MTVITGSLIKSDSIVFIDGLSVLRIAQEGALSIIPFIQNRTVKVERADIVKLLHASDIEKPPEISVFSDDLQGRLEKIATGSIIYLFKGTIYSDDIFYCLLILDETTGMPVEFVGWKGKTSVRAYVPKQDRLHYLRMIGEDTSIFETNKFEEKKERDKIRLEARLNKDQNNGSSNNGDGDESSGEEDNGDS